PPRRQPGGAGQLAGVGFEVLGAVKLGPDRFVAGEVREGAGGGGPGCLRDSLLDRGSAHRRIHSPFCRPAAWAPPAGTVPRGFPCPLGKRRPKGGQRRPARPDGVAGGIVLIANRFPCSRVKGPPGDREPIRFCENYARPSWEGSCSAVKNHASDTISISPSG